MTSLNPNPSPDAPVSVKITIAGTEENKKFRLTLKDLGAATLPDKLRENLAVDSTQETTFQRFSDSSASWIALDSNEPAVYKQLYRAAKAKGRLRLRVTITDKRSQAPQMSGTPLTPSERLPKRSYVQPYVTDAGMDQSPSSRISMLEDFKTLSAAPSNITLTPSIKSATEVKSDTPKHFWPITSDGDFSEKAKAKFERPQSSISVKSTLSSQSNETEGAPVPGFFDFNDEQFVAPPRSRCPALQANSKWMSGRPTTGRDSCLSKMAQVQHNHVVERQTAASNAYSNFVIWCNQCDNAIPDAHWHCSICDGGDYDICLKCADSGALCSNDQHWLIKRFLRDGKIITSTTETLAPKKSVKRESKTEIPGAYNNEPKGDQTPQPQRTCNSCVQVYPEQSFYTCKVCDDFDLCTVCIVADEHGHHPAHGFEPAVKGSSSLAVTEESLAPGHGFHHAAVCDGCDKAIIGVRHKCLDCPDWDYCDTCALSAAEIHPGHRLAPLYEAVASPGVKLALHQGVYCDGPLCATNNHRPIFGDRYKCAVCHDTDFCARCEALPTLEHNRTHPLLKFRTPIRNVSVSTYGEKANGETMRPMGDHYRSTSSKSTETTPAAPSTNASTQVQSTPVATVKEEPHEAEEEASQQAPKGSDLTKVLKANFMYDTVTDGTVIAPATQFTQTWTIVNPGPYAWPAGCSVCFVGGDSMFNVDPNHPSSILQLNKALSTNTMDREVLPGEQIDFSVTMRTQEREGRAISYWNLKTPDGEGFGHRLWCDIVVRKPDEVIKASGVEFKTEASKEETLVEVEKESEEVQGSQMIFPKLEKESPVSSYHAPENVQANTVLVNKAVLSPAEQDLLDDVESLELDDKDDVSSEEDGFLTDEEYELIDTGDEMEVAKNGKK